MLSDGQDYYCYNFTLQTAFQSAAQVAIGKECLTQRRILSSRAK